MVYIPGTTNISAGVHNALSTRHHCISYTCWLTFRIKAASFCQFLQVNLTWSSRQQLLSSSSSWQQPQLLLMMLGHHHRGRWSTRLSTFFLHRKITILEVSKNHKITPTFLRSWQASNCSFIFPKLISLTFRPVTDIFRLILILYWYVMIPQHHL